MKKLSLSIALFFVSLTASFAGNGEEGVTLVKESCVTVNGYIYTFVYIASDGSRVYSNEVLHQKAVLHTACNEVCVAGIYYSCENAGKGYQKKKGKK